MSIRSASIAFAGSTRTGQRHYRAPTEAGSLAREEHVLRCFSERIQQLANLTDSSQSGKIETGYDINPPTDGAVWTHWHHMFNPGNYC